MAGPDTNNNNPDSPKKFMDFVGPYGANSLKPKQPEKSKTLMRSVVHKPALKYSHKQTSLPLEPVDASKTVLPKTYVHAVDSQRQARASNANRSELISRFNSRADDDQDYTPKQSPEVKPDTSKVEAQADSLQPAAPPPVMNIFEKAIEDAPAVNEPLLPKQRRGLAKRLTIASASVLSVLLIGGFFAYQNFNKLDLYLASTKAGFSDITPSYKPTGYGLASVSSGSGVIETVYNSNTNSKSYTLSEKKSNFTSSDLLQNFVLNTAGQNYETVISNGLTIYLYAPHSATWVNGGIWYIISANSSLSDQQLVQLASSS